MDCGQLVNRGNFGDMGDWLWCCASRFTTKDLAIIFYGVRKIWFCRNALAHGKECMNVEAATFITKDRVNKYLSPYFKFLIIGEDDELTWEAPEASVIKIKCDGSWLSTSKRAEFGCIVRDNMGCLIGVRAGFMEGISNVEVEDISILHAMNWAADANWESCIFETGSGECLKNSLPVVVVLFK